MHLIIVGEIIVYLSSCFIDHPENRAKM